MRRPSASARPAGNAVREAETQERVEPEVPPSMIPRLVQASCPRCGAALSITPGAPQVACAYCGTTVFVQPPKRATGVFAPPPAGQPIVQLDAQQWTELGGLIAKGTIGVTIAIVTAVVIAIAGGLAATVVAVRSAPATRRSGGAAGAPAEDVVASAPPEVTYDFGALGSCECKVKVADKEGYASLSAVVSGTDDAHLTGSYVLGAPGDRALDLPVTDETAPPRSIKGRSLGLAMLCDRSVVAVVAGAVASGWSLEPKKKAKLLWTTPLPGKYVYPGSGNPKKGHFSIDCANGEGDVVGFSTVAGAVRLRVADGALIAPKGK